MYCIPMANTTNVTYARHMVRRLDVKPSNIKLHSCFLIGRIFYGMVEYYCWYIVPLYLFQWNTRHCPGSLCGMRTSNWSNQPEMFCFLILTKVFLVQMMGCKELVLTLLFSFMMLSCAKERQCPGSKTSCPDDSTCCPLQDGSYGCCPIKNAVCCQDSVHCCPGGFSCDVVKGVCQMGDKSKPLLKKIPAIPTVVCWWFIFLFTHYNLFVLLKVWACLVYIFIYRSSDRVR